MYNIMSNEHGYGEISVAYFTEEVNLNLTKPPSNFNGSLAVLELTL